MDVGTTIEPKSDQLNSDDLIAGPITIKITKVTGAETKEQPVNIYFEGDNGKPYKPCKSMRRVLVQIWGRDGASYLGRSMTLYRDPEVKFGGIAVGGIRIGQMSHLEKEITLVLTASKTSRKPFVVKPLTQANGNGNGAAPVADDQKTAVLKSLLSDLNAANDEIKWSPAKSVAFATEFFGREIKDYADLTDEEKDSLTANLQERLDGLKAPVSEPNERPADPDPVEDPLESLRANVQAALEELPKSRQKDLIAGKPSVAKMNSDELNQLAIEIRTAS